MNHFYWSKTASVAYASSYSDSSKATTDKFFTNDSNFQVDGYAKGEWRTLSKAEWAYLLGNSTERSGKYKTGVTVCEKGNCLILAPDDFSGTIAGSYDTTTWEEAEAKGLVCLPAAGYRNVTGVNVVGSSGYYWSSTPNENGANNAYYLSFDSGDADTGNNVRKYGCCVRLVKNVEN